MADQQRQYTTQEVIDIFRQRVDWSETSTGILTNCGADEHWCQICDERKPIEGFNRYLTVCYDCRMAYRQDYRKPYSDRKRSSTFEDKRYKSSDPTDFDDVAKFDRPWKESAKARGLRIARETRRLEQAAVEEIMEGLKSEGYKPIKNHGTPHVRRGQPDISVLIRCEGWPFAVFFGIEVKRDRETKPRKQQAHVIRQILDQGGVAFAASDWPTVQAFIEDTKKEVRDFTRNGGFENAGYYDFYLPKLKS